MPGQISVAINNVVLFIKDLDDDGYIQLHLIRQHTPKYNELSAKIGVRRWGPLDTANPPVSVNQIAAAKVQLEQKAEQTPYAFAGDREIIESTTLRRARDKAFRSLVLDQYEHRCAFTGRKFVSPITPSILGLDAAHIILVSERGSDHPANGLALSKDLHWAFDKGLVGVAADRTVLVPASVRRLSGNEFLRDLHGSPLREARDGRLRALEEALEWHRHNRLVA